MAFSSWWATVRYSLAAVGLGSSEKRNDNVPVSSLRIEFVGKRGKLKTRPFEPQNLKDFQPDQWYVVVTSKDSQDGKAHPFHALIGRLAETVHDLKAKELPRIKWPSVPEPPAEAETSESGSEPQSVVLAQRTQRLSSKSNKRKADQEIFDNYIANTQLVDDESIVNDESMDTLREKIRVLEQEKAQFLQDQATRNASFSSESFEESVKSGISNLQSKMESLHSTVSSLSQEIGTMKEEIGTILSESPRKSPSFVRDWVHNLPLTTKRSLSIKLCVLFLQKSSQLFK